MIDPQVADDIAAVVGSIDSVDPVGGGCISNACRIEISGLSYFLKWSGGEAGQTFKAEAIGLQALKDAEHRLVVPNVLSVRNSGNGLKGHVLMDWISEGPRGRDFWSNLGTGLSELHRFEGPSFGFESDNFIGRIEQQNTPTKTWPEFFLESRLAFQRKLAQKMGRWKSRWDAHFDALANRITEILPKNPPASLVHGDLWGGNVLATSTGDPVLIDPAVHYAHREVDLAMTELFGGFSASFYDAYRATWSLEPGYPERRDVYNLYHLINHLNHFGSSYAGQVESILRRF